MPHTAEAAHVETVLTDIARIRDYGPLGITTWVEGIPDIRYQRPAPADADQRRTARLGSGRIAILGQGEELRVQVEDQDGDVVVSLQPAEIESVWVDHPFGQNMPLHGREMMMPDVTQLGRVPSLRWARYALELDQTVRVETATHPEYSGVGIVNLYNISGTGGNMTLEEAKETQDPMSCYLISRVDGRRAVMTSVIGYEQERAIAVRPPEYPENVSPMHVDLFDMPKGTPDDDLLAVHRKRVESYDNQRSLRFPEKQIALDGIFLYAVSD